MPNRFQIKRTTTTGLLPNVTNSSNTTYIAAGELAINLTDKKLLSSNGSATFEIGANLTNLAVSGNVSATYYIGDGSYLTGLYGVVGEYLFANTVSDVSPYYQAQFVGNYTAGTTAENTVSVTNSPTLLGAFLTNVGFPNQTYIPIGTIGVTFETQKASGASTYRTYAEIYKRTSGGTETLLITSDVSSTSALNTLIQQSVSATNSTQITLNLTDRILIKIYAQIISGADANITLRWDDATSSGFNLPAPPASITQFVPYLNATANVNLGSYSIIAASHTVGTTLAANATGLFVSSAAPQISLNNATSNWITFSTNGVAAPATTTRSAGTKLALYPSLNATQVDYAIGIESNHMWFSTDNATTGVKFYANTNNYMTANVAGLTVTGYANVSSTLAAGNTSITGFINVSSTANVGGATTLRGTATVNGALTVANTAALGNTTITGFANVSTTATIGTGFTLTSGNANFDNGVLFVDGTNNRVGVNNTTPGHALSVTGTLFAGNTTINGDLAIGGVDAGPNFISFRGTTGDSPNSYNHTYVGERIHTASEASELFLFKGNDPSTSGPDRVRIGAAEFRVDTYATALSGTFETVASSANLTNKFIITNAGNVGIGNSTPSSKLVVAGAVELGNTTITGFANVSSTLAAGNTTITGFITATGDITAFFSDDRLKDRYSNIPNAVEKVKSLNGFYYEPNITAQDLGYQKEMHVGVSAQEVNAIMPEIVAPAPIDNKYLTVKYDRLIPLLIEAIKEQQIQIDELKAQLNKD